MDNMEEVIEVRTFMTQRLCESCYSGYMKPNGTEYLTYPAQIEHECSICHAKQVFFKSYPVITYKTKEKE